MSAFSDFLLSCIPVDDHVSLEPILSRFHLEFSVGTEPSVAYPFKLSPLDIGLLIDLARKYQLEKLMIGLASMGTVELTPEGAIKDPFDPMIGQKDATIEAAIIAKAIEIQSTKKNTGETTSPRFVYGLSGNPATLNHQRFIAHLLHGGDVTVVLNSQSPLKSLDSYVAPDIRFEMLHSMIESMSGHFEHSCYLSRLEVDRLPPSRMVVTMSMLTLLSRDNEQHTLVLGLDALPLFTKWYQWQALGKLCHIKFYPRPAETLNYSSIEHYLQLLEEGGVVNALIGFNTEPERIAFLESYPKRKTFVESIPDITAGSATKIREYYLRMGTLSARTVPPPELNIPEPVHQSILRHGLFGSNIEVTH